MIDATFLRDGLRPLRRRRGITIIVIVTLALGVGVNAGIFSIFHQVLLQRINVPQPGEIVVMDSPGPRNGSVSTDGTGRDRQVFSFPLYEDLRGVSDKLTGMGAFRSIAVNLGARGRTSSGSGLLVSGNYFNVLGVQPSVGRFFSAQELVAPGVPRVTVLSHAFWQERFGGDRSVIGEGIMVNGESLEVIGVAPRGFRGLNRFQTPDIYLPVTLVADLTIGRTWDLEDRNSHWLYVFGRLAAGASIEQARTSLAPTFGHLIREVEAPLNEAMSDTWMQRFVERELDLLPAARGQANTLESARTPLILLLIVAGLVLLVACVNITNLLLAVGASERGETAVRQALGAGRRHILGQRALMLAVLALVGGAVSLPVAMATLTLVTHLLPPGDSGVLSAALDWTMVGAGLAVSTLAIALAGIVPVVQALTSRPIEAMREQVARAGLSRAATRFRSSLVTAQIALALALLVVSGLFIYSLVNINRIDLGLDAEPVLGFSVSPARNGYPPEQSRELFRTVEQRLAQTPGMAAAAVSMVPILSDSNWTNNVSVQGFDATPDTDTQASFNAIGPAFFEALSIPLLRGRSIGAADTQDRPRVAVVNRAFVDKFDLQGNVVGKRMALGSGGELDIEIVGVVADAAYSTVKDKPPPQFFLSMYQTEHVGSASFYVRAIDEPEALIPVVRDLVAELDPNLPVDNLASLDVALRQTIVLDRLVGTLALAFAALASGLAAIGLFGVLMFALAQRTGEIGLRAALGAGPGRLKRMVVAHTLRLALVGAAIGLVLAWLLGDLARGLLYELTPLEPQVLLGALAVLLIVVLAAGYYPARRAASVQPVEALRYE